MNTTESEVTSPSTATDVYQIVTDRVIELLEAGTVPWHKPWVAEEWQAPRNLVSKKAYRGINVWLLSVAGYGSPYWLSFKQAKSLGGSVKKGEKSTLVIFWKPLETEDKKTGEKKTIRLLRYYRVFNVEQCEGIEYPKPESKRPADFNPIAEAEKIVNGMPNAPVITHGGGQAYYRPSTDQVNMPARDSFKVEQEYYSTLFHELAHSTGHASRLGRQLNEPTAKFGSESYAKEELLAEMSAAFLSANAGILHRTIGNTAAYIKSWLARLRDDRKLVVNAAAAAQRATDYILAVEHEPAKAVVKG